MHGEARGGANGNGAYLGACAKHFASRASGRCEDCGDLYCSDCLVPPVRKRQPTRCIDCALVAAGVRAKGSRRNHVTNMTRAQKRPTNLF